MSTLWYRTLHRGDVAMVGSGRSEVAFLIRDTDAFVAHWRTVTGRVFTADGEPVLTPAPAVDLATEAVVVVSLGSRPCTGFDLVIDRILIDGDDLVVEATETTPNGGFDAVVWPVHTVAIPGRDLPFNDNGNVVLRLSVVPAPPPPPPPSWAGCFVLFEGRTVDEVQRLLPGYDAGPSQRGGSWTVVTDLDLTLVTDGERLRRWSAQGRIVQFTVLEPHVCSHATLWDGGHEQWSISFEFALDEHLVIAGTSPPTKELEDGFFGPHDAAHAVTGWLPPLAKFW
ncbi:hypothetical protein ACQP2E_18800 [Actinoplanes sp. CA-015351]|uniref:hypothetical protein n=1 Tax=Actinoplanes sp. CA-015351 TaxID=3239897 RepID=UPI003D996A8D